jgi:3-isopropylmalate dehydratase small subunit
MPERQVVAATFNDEWQASLFRETLLAAGIPCVIAGSFTGSFRAEAPGRVKLLVHERDMDRAAEAIRKRREEALTIDWSQVDVDGDHEATDSGDGSEWEPERES